jgi:hypothetical protein
MLRGLTQLVFVSALLSSALPAAAQDATTPSAQNWTAEGVLDSASRSFQASDERDGTFYLNFQVIAFDTPGHAEKGMGPFITAILENLRPQESVARPIVAIDPPSIGNAAIAYEGWLLMEGNTFDAAVLVIRDGRYLHSWFALGRGFAANPLLDLATLAEPFFPDPFVSSTTPEPTRLLDSVPALSDLPLGFALTGEIEK